MPFDPVNFARIATKDEFAAADQRGKLAMLSFALRHHPSTHYWDFARVGGTLGYMEAQVKWATERGLAHIDDDLIEQTKIHNCNSAGCAIGLANALWGTTVSTYTDERLAIIFGLGDGCYALYGERTHDKITPEMVADQLDTYLATTI